jgi:hypothetical protein
VQRAFCLTLLLAFGAAPAAAQPTGAPATAAPAAIAIAIEVDNFDATGLPRWWSPGFDPGEALAAILADRLGKRPGIHVIVPGQGAAEVAAYRIDGIIVHFDNAGSPGYLRGPHYEIVDFQAGMRIVDAGTGREVLKVTDHKSSNGTSFKVDPPPSDATGRYTDPKFTNSAMGQLLVSSAESLIGKIDFSKLKRP